MHGVWYLDGKAAAQVSASTAYLVFGAIFGGILVAIGFGAIVVERRQAKKDLRK